MLDKKKLTKYIQHMYLRAYWAWIWL